MDIGKALRRRLIDSGQDRIDCTRDEYRLTILRLADSPRVLTFALSEARPHGWWPVVTGRVTGQDEVLLIRGESKALKSFPEIVAYMLNGATLITAASRTPFSMSNSDEAAQN